MSDVVTQHIEKTPGICGGKACIAGHRIRVMDIAVWYELRGCSPEEIVAMFPGINLVDVFAALTYYFQHRDEIEADFRADEESVQQLLTQYPSKVREKLACL